MCLPVVLWVVAKPIFSCFCGAQNDKFKLLFVEVVDGKDEVELLVEFVLISCSFSFVAALDSVSTLGFSSSAKEATSTLVPGSPPPVIVICTSALITCSLGCVSK